MMINLAMFGVQKPDNYVPHAYVMYTEVEGVAPMQMGISELLYANHLSHLLWNCVKLLEEKP